MRKLHKSATLSTWFFIGSKLVILLFLTSLIIKKFSVGEIALWYLYGSVMGFAHLFDVGFSTTIIRFTAYNSSAEDQNAIQKGFQKLYNSMNTVFLGLGVIVVLFLCGIGYFSVYPVIEENNISSGITSFLVILVILPINFFLKKNDAFIRGLNYVSLYNNWNAIMYFITGVLTVTALFLNMPFYIIVLVNQLGLLINSIKNVFLLKKVLGFEVNLFGFSYEKSIINEYWKPTWKSALISFSSNGMSHLTNILVPTFVTSIGVVASYLFSMRLIQFINEFSWAPFYSQIPRYIKEYKQGEIKQLSKHSYARMNWSLIIVVVGICGLGVFANVIMPFFETKTTFISYSLTGFVMLMIVQERIVAMHSQVVMFANNIEHYKQYVIMSVIYGIMLYVGLNMVDGETDQGLYCVSIAYVIAASYPLVVIGKRSLNLLETGVLDYLKSHFYKIILVITVCFLILISL